MSLEISYLNRLDVHRNIQMQRPCAEKWRDHLIRQVFGIVKTIGIQFLYDQLSKVAAIEFRIERKRV